MNKLTEKNSPKFDNPPVIEVIALAQFSPIDEKYLLLNVAKIWDVFGRDNFPIIDYKNSYLRPSNNNQPKIKFFNEDQFQFPRIWLESSDRRFVMQVQSDRLSISWRRLNDSGKSDYGCYDDIWKKFLKALQIISQLASQNQLEINFLELCYINLIPFDDFGGADNINNCIPAMKSKVMPGYLGEIETVNFEWETPTIQQTGTKFKIQGLTGTDKNTGDRLLKLSLSQKGAVDIVFGDDTQKINDWFDDAHLKIVYTFKDITSDFMHKKWSIRC